MRGDDLRKIREKFKLTQKELADKLGLKENTVTKMESRSDNPKHRRKVIPRTEKLVKLLAKTGGLKK